jgi:hypothetical protein
VAGGFPAGGSEIQQFVRNFSAIERRLRELEIPTGTQVQSTSATAQAAVVRANTAQSSAVTAQSAAVVADGKAVQAQGQANTATTNAATAQTQANTATTNAATAQTSANTADGKAVTAQGAANAAQTAANNAATAAATADGKASIALTTANGKNKIIFSTSAASGTAYVEGDTWFKTTAALITGQWVFTSGAWAARTIDNLMIANIDAGKITAGIIAAARIDATTLQGKTLQTAASGARVVIDSTGLKGYDAAGIVKTSVGTDGLLTAAGAVITGTVRTGTTGQRAELSSTSAKFYSPSGAVSSVEASNASDNSALLALAAGGGSLLVGKVNLPSSGSVGVSAPDAWINRVFADQLNNNLGQPLLQVSGLGGVGATPAGVIPITKVGCWGGAYFSGGTSNQVFDGAFPTKCASIQMTMSGGNHSSAAVYLNTLGPAGLTIAASGGYTGNANIYYTAVGW